MRAARAIGAGLLGYSLGSIPSARVAARLAGAGIDLNAEGTCNAGAFNASKLLGKRWGLGVAAVDIGKGWLAGRLGGRLAGDTGCYLAATTSIAGHCYPPAGIGGKGAATSFGSCLAAFPLYAPVEAGVAAAAVALRRNAPPGSRATPAVLATTSVFLMVSAVWSWRRWPNPGGPRSGPGLFAYAAASAALILPRWLRP